MNEAIKIMQTKLWKEISNYKPITGEKLPEDKRIKEAFFKSPRHVFLKKFIALSEAGQLNIRDTKNKEDLRVAYSNQPLLYVNGDLRVHESSNSEPAFILHLVNLMNIRPSESVLEIGSGTGWLLSILSHMVGDSGSVTGIEVENDLADQSRRNIKEMGLSNAKIVCGDAYELCKNKTIGKFDKVIITAAMEDIPNFLYDIIKEGGILCVPIKNKGPAEEVLILERNDIGFSSRHIRVCKFVPMKKYADTGSISDYKTVPGLQSSSMKNFQSRGVQIGPYNDNRDMPFILPFTSYFSKTSPDFRVWRISPDVNGRFNNSVFGDWETFCMGLVTKDSDGGERVECAWRKGILYFNPKSDCGERFLKSLREWRRLGEPTGADFSVIALPKKMTSSKHEDLNKHVDERSESILIWSI